MAKAVKLKVESLVGKEVWLPVTPTRQIAMKGRIYAEKGDLVFVTDEKGRSFSVPKNTVQLLQA